MTYLSWRRGLVLAAVDGLLEQHQQPGRGPAAEEAWQQLQRQLEHSLPPQEIRAALEELLLSRRHLCQPPQLQLIETLRPTLAEASPLEQAESGG